MRLATEIIVYLSLLIKASDFIVNAATCEFKNRLRDKWYFVGQNRNSYLRIRRTAIQFRIGRHDRIRFKCVRNRGNIYLVKKPLFQPGMDAVLCIGFSYIADHPEAEYSLVRLMAPGLGSHIMSPRLIRHRTKLTINGTCQFVHGGGRRQFTFIKRRKPGCRFPKKLHGDWNFTYRKAHHLTFNLRNMTLVLLSGETITFQCHTRDNGLYLVRTRGFRNTEKDGVLCLRIEALPEDPFYDYEMSRLNSGEELDDQLMMVPSYKPVHLHRDCQWIDSPARPHYLYPL
ncbi:uncharacterized protein LOC121382291 [Gigantopelta aegis]|uniref:uncharacterized protein LOC121382291 n=1 Tax=Gigantopelta aegis TaxID=1735272 RepID=UPI001B887BCD|nr:uncharacterized protein LOC121382291 [Gigantopelta aegis]